MHTCIYCGEEIEEWEFDDGLASKFDDGAMHEACREAYEEMHGR